MSPPRTARLLPASVQPAPSRVGGRPHGGRVGRPAGLGQGQRPRDRARGHLGEEALPHRVVAGLADRGGELADGRDERAGRVGAAELLDDDRELDRPEPEPTERLGDGQRRPAQLDHVLPQRLGHGAVLDDGAHQAHRALALEDGAHPVAQVVLLGGEVQLHVGENGT